MVAAVYPRTDPINTRIPAGWPLHEMSQVWMRYIPGPWTCSVQEFTPAVWSADKRTPLVPVRIIGSWSDYRSGPERKDGRTMFGPGWSSGPPGVYSTVPAVPVPAQAVAAPGGDGQVVLIQDTAEGQLEWTFWQFARDDARGSVTGFPRRVFAASGTVRPCDPASPLAGSVFPDGRAGRGAGMSYLAGLIRPAEIAAGRIEHALALGFRFPAGPTGQAGWLPPASKSDGKSDRSHPGLGADLVAPEGALLQLDPAVAVSQLPTGVRVVARALQEYGAYVVDCSGRTKLYAEAQASAGWGESGKPTAPDLTGLPLDQIRVLNPLWRSVPGGLPGEVVPAAGMSLRAD